LESTDLYPSHRKKREAKIKRDVKRGIREANDQNPFEIFVTVTDIRYTCVHFFDAYISLLNESQILQRVAKNSGKYIRNVCAAGLRGYYAQSFGTDNRDGGGRWAGGPAAEDDDLSKATLYNDYGAFALPV
jgi:hypothetical protein